MAREWHNIFKLLGFFFTSYSLPMSEHLRPPIAQLHTIYGFSRSPKVKQITLTCGVLHLFFYNTCVHLSTIFYISHII